MQLLQIDIVKDVLKSQFGFSIHSETAKTFIINNIFNQAKKTLLLIDFRNVVFDHYFARTFGDLFIRVSNKNDLLDAIFILKDFQTEDFLLGLLDSQNIPYSQGKNGDIQSCFIENSLSIKFMLEENKIAFISKLNRESYKLLEFINHKLETDFDEIYTQKILESGEDIYPIIDELIRLRFIYSDSAKKYHSVYKHLNIIK